MPHAYAGLFQMLIKRCTEYALLVGLVTGVSVSFVPNDARAERGPVLHIQEASYDFGSVQQGQRVEHEFVIKNDGDSDLVIQRLSPSCGCTAATVSANTVKPGGTERIRVTFNTAGFYGRKTKSVSIVTNSTQQSEGTLQLFGTIERGVTVTPERVDLGELSTDSSLPMRTREVVVEVQEGVSREVVAVRAISPYISVTSLGGQGRSKKYSIRLLPETPRGLFRDRVLIEFKDPDQPAINVPVTASIVGDLRLIPSAVSFGILSGDQVMERRVRFENTSRVPVDVREVRTSHPAVTASVVPVEPGKRSVVVITVDPKRVSGDLKTSIEVVTSSADQGVLPLAVFGVQPPQ